MTQLVTVLMSASQLSADLFDRAQDPIFADKQRTAFRVDALNVVSATQALSTSPGHGYSSELYDRPRDECGQARGAVGTIDAGSANSMHMAHLETVQAVEAMRAVTARPAVSVN